MAKKRKSSKRSKKSSGRGGLTITGLLIILLVLGGLYLGDTLGLIEINWEEVAEEVTTIIEEEAGGDPASPETTAPVVEPVSGEWYELYFTTPQFPDNPDTRVRVIEQGLIEAIDGAQATLDIAIYELDLPNVGAAILAARDRGVQVRLVTDSDTLEEDEVLIGLEQAGLDIVPDERSAIMHHKFMVVDGQAVWTGSWNFTPNGTFRNNNHAIYMQSAELARIYTTEFEEMFQQQAFGPTSPANTSSPVVQLGETLVEVCFSPEDDCDILIEEVVAGAEQSIRFMAFSFTMDDLGQIILNRAEAGVTVQGVFENRGSGTEFSEYGRLAQAGLDVHKDGNPYTMHHKVFILDETTVALGSFNFSENAASSNDENLVIIDNPAIAAQFLAEFERVYQQALNPPES